MMYYNYLNDRMEELDPEYHALNLPKSKEEYQQREYERMTVRTPEDYKKLVAEYPLKPSECFRLPVVGDEVIENEYEGYADSLNESYEAWKKMSPEERELLSQQQKMYIINKPDGTTDSVRGDKIEEYLKEQELEEKKVQRGTYATEEMKASSKELEEVWMKLKEEDRENITKALDPLKHHPANQGNPKDNFIKYRTPSIEEFVQGFTFEYLEETTSGMMFIDNTKDKQEPISLKTYRDWVEVTVWWKNPPNQIITETYEDGTRISTTGSFRNFFAPFTDEQLESLIKESKIRVKDMPTTTYPITNGENTEPVVPATTKNKRESFYDVRANQFAEKQANNLSRTLYDAGVDSYWNEEQEVENYEVFQTVNKKGKYLAMFLLGCAAALTLYVYFNGIMK